MPSDELKEYWAGWGYVWQDEGDRGPGFYVTTYMSLEKAIESRRFFEVGEVEEEEEKL